MHLLLRLKREIQVQCLLALCYAAKRTSTFFYRRGDYNLAALWKQRELRSLDRIHDLRTQIPLRVASRG